MKKEIAIGIVAGLLAYLYYTGYNITPLIIIGVLGFAAFVISKKKGLLKLDTHSQVVENREINFEDIGGQDTAKQELKEALEFLLKSSSITQMGIRPLKGILLTGPPGTGKTLLARAAAGYSDAVFLATSGSEFIEMYAGVGAQRVRTLFKSAREIAKKQKKNRTIIFIDEIEVLGGKRGSHSSHLEYDQTLNQLLVEMDGLTNDKNIQILIVAATNRADLLDSALLRPGRFDRIVKVDLPDKESRLAILNLHCRNKPLAADVDIEEIAAGTYGFSGAHLESLTNEAAILALRDNCAVISQGHLREAVDKVILGEKLSSRANKETLRRVAIHEAGHAFISEFLNPGSVDQVTVTSRGNALGYVRHTQKEDQQLFTKTALEKQIMILLAGAVSEDILLGERSTGAANDFQQALNMTERIVMSGLSRLGVVSAEVLPKHELFMVYQEILQALEIKTHEILSRSKQALDRIINTLETSEKISGAELRRVIGTGGNEGSIVA